MLHLLHLHRLLFTHTSPSCRSILSIESSKVFGRMMGNSLPLTSPFSSTTSAMGSYSDGQAPPDFYQHVVVLRHGDRLDNFDQLWKITAARPWDPPLFEQGLIRAFSTGLKLRKSLGFPIHRVFVSPFLRCVQTAAQVVSALCAVDDEPKELTGDHLPFDPTKVKVSVEFGLCEMLNRRAIRIDAPPKNGDWGFDIPMLEAMLPAGTVDANVDQVYKKLPQWEEAVLGSRRRYSRTFKVLADKYPTENLLLVTHGEGVGVSVSEFMEDATVYGSDYCAYSELRRPVFRVDQSLSTGNFDVLTKPGKTGVSYCISSTVPDNIDQTKC